MHISPQTVNQTESFITIRTVINAWIVGCRDFVLESTLVMEFGTRDVVENSLTVFTLILVRNPLELTSLSLVHSFFRLLQILTFHASVDKGR